MGFRDLFSRRIKADCGHKTKRCDVVNAFGESTVTKINLPKGRKTTAYCHRCLEKMAIRCAWCGGAIFIGDPITLYTPKPEYNIPEHAVRWEEHPEQLVGCLRWECADTGGDRAGFWIPPGKVHRVPSPLELMMAQMANGGAPQMMFVGDLSDPAEAHRQAAEILGKKKDGE